MTLGVYTLFSSVMQMFGHDITHKYIVYLQMFGTDITYKYIVYLQMFGTDIVVLNSHETIHEALVTKATEFAGRPGTYRTDILRRGRAGVAFSTYSKEWAFRKKAAMRALKVSIPDF